MTLEELKQSLSETHPPHSLDPRLKALWYDAKGDWEEAHNIAQDIGTRDGSWIHAYLHRKEGDEGNARYWYSRAGKGFPSHSLNEEWEELASHFLGS